MLRAVWAGLAVLAGPAFADALGDDSRGVQLVASVGLWLLWAGGLVATLVPTTVSLTAVRLLAPGAVAAAVWAWADGAASRPAAVALASALATLVAFTAEVGRAYVQGSAYGDESRFPLRPPGLLLVGPLPVAWAVTMAAGVAGPLMLGARQWVAGGVAVAAGGPVVVLGVSRLHRLARRWVVLVPAGLVLHDPIALADTALFRRSQIRRLALAGVDTDATDLTLHALGLAVELTLIEPVTVVAAGGRGGPKARPVAVEGVLFSPSRPGALLAEAALRSLPVAAR